MIETLKVQNYKSLKNIEIPLKPLTVLVGPNAAGKSNILDCLSFLSELGTYQPATGEANQSFNKRGGYSDIVWGGKKEGLISISCKWQPRDVGKQPFHYLLVIKEAQPGPPLCIVEEILSPGVPGQDSFHRRENKMQINSDQWQRVNGYESILHRLSKPLANEARDVISNWSFYDFVTQSMRQPQQVAKQIRLNHDGSNVAALLHWIFVEERKIFSIVEEHLKAAIPEVEELSARLTDEKPSKTYIAWREKDIPGRIPAWNMSEGSVRLVAMLLGLLVPQPPPLVAFENPDLHLHAHLMEYLAEILKVGSKHSQVIITTHSPYLLDHIPPESVLIVWKEAGETKVKPVKDTAELKEALKTLGLGELYYTGSLGGVP